MVIKSWKTTLAGFLVILLGAAKLLFPKVITNDVAGAILTLLTAAGLIAAKDSAVTGGTIPNSPSIAKVVQETSETNQ